MVGAKCYDVYLWLIDQRDKNHSKNGFTFFGYIFQTLVTIYSKVFFRIDKSKSNNE